MLACENPPPTVCTVQNSAGLSDMGAEQEIAQDCAFTVSTLLPLPRLGVLCSLTELLQSQRVCLLVDLNRKNMGRWKGFEEWLEEHKSGLHSAVSLSSRVGLTAE